MNKYKGLPDDVSRIVSLACSNHLKNIPPSMVIPLNKGNGRTSLLAHIADRFKEGGAIDFSSPYLYLEYDLTGTIADIHKTHISIQSNCRYANQYQGVVALGLDGLLPQLTDAAGEDFFAMVKSVKAYATVLLFVPADCCFSSLHYLLHKTGGSIQLVKPIEPSVSDIVSIFFDSLPDSIKATYCRPKDLKKCTETVSAYIASATPYCTITSAIELAKNLLYKDEEALVAIFGGQTIQKKEANHDRRTVEYIK